MGESCRTRPELFKSPADQARRRAGGGERRKHDLDYVLSRTIKALMSGVNLALHVYCVWLELTYCSMYMSVFWDCGGLFVYLFIFIGFVCFFFDLLIVSCTKITHNVFFFFFVLFTLRPFLLPLL